MSSPPWGTYPLQDEDASQLDFYPKFELTPPRDLDNLLADLGVSRIPTPEPMSFEDLIRSSPDPPVHIEATTPAVVQSRLATPPPVASSPLASLAAPSSVESIIAALLLTPAFSRQDTDIALPSQDMLDCEMTHDAQQLATAGKLIFRSPPLLQFVLNYLIQQLMSRMSVQIGRAHV